MRKVKEVLRLRLTAGLSSRQIALCTGVGKSVVSKHVARAGELGLVRAARKLTHPTFRN